MIQTRTAQVAVLVVALTLPVTTVSPATRIGADGHVTHARQTQTVIVIELTHGIVDRRHARNAGYACGTRPLVTMRADIATLESSLVKLGAGRLQQVKRHPHIVLNLQHRMSTHDVAGNPHAIELTNLNRGAVHKRKTQNIVQTSPGRSLPCLKVCGSLARKCGRAPFALQSGAQRRFVLVVRLDVHGAAIGR